MNSDISYQQNSTRKYQILTVDKGLLKLEFFTFYEKISDTSIKLYNPILINII